MSYCRWSSDDFQCDIYAYGDVSGGVTIHVAKNRTVIEPGKVPQLPDRWWESDDHEGNAKLMNERNAYFRACEHREIGLPHDGESFYGLSEDEAADKLIELRTVGYNVPQYAIDSLREDAAASIESDVTQESSDPDKLADAAFKRKP